MKVFVVDFICILFIDVIGIEREKLLYIFKVGLFCKWLWECGYYVGWLLIEIMELGVGVIIFIIGVYIINLEKE